MLNPPPPRALEKMSYPPLQVVKIIHKYIWDIPKTTEDHFSVGSNKYRNRNQFRFNLEKLRFINTNLDFNYNALPCLDLKIALT